MYYLPCMLKVYLINKNKLNNYSLFYIIVLGGSDVKEKRI